MNRALSSVTAPCLSSATFPSNKPFDLFWPIAIEFSVAIGDLSAVCVWWTWSALRGTATPHFSCWTGKAVFAGFNGKVGFTSWSCEDSLAGFSGIGGFAGLSSKTSFAGLSGRAGWGWVRNRRWAPIPPTGVWFGALRAKRKRPREASFTRPL